MSDKLLFTCRVCGCDVDTHPVIENEVGEKIGVQGVCVAHCEDHDYEYDPCAREHFCLHCGAIAPDDWYYSGDDVLPFVGSYEPREPGGTPASAMNGNAAERRKNPEAWDCWVAFCNSWGMP